MTSCETADWRCILSQPVNVERLVTLMRELDAEQQKTDWFGGREIAWYYYRGDVEAALNLEPGALDTGEYAPTEES